MIAAGSQKAEAGASPESPRLDGPLAKRLDRVRGRLAWLAAVDGAVTGAAVGAAAAAVLVAAGRWQAIGPSGTTLAATVFAAAAVGATARGAQRISWAACARLIDQVLDQQDRVLSAVWLAGSPSPLARAAVADALARTERLAPQMAAPARRPSGLSGLAWAAVALAVAWLVPAGSHAARLAAPHPSHSATAPLPPALLDAELSAAALARARADRSGDGALRDLAAELDRVIRGLTNGTVDESAALEALRVLDARAAAAAVAAARDAQALSGASKALAATAATRDAAEALGKGAAGHETAGGLGNSAARQPGATAAALRAAAEAVSQTASGSSDDEGAPQRRLHRNESQASGASDSGAERRRDDEDRKLERLSRDLDDAARTCATGDAACRARAESSGRELGDLQRGARTAPSLRDLERTTRQLHDRIARGDLRAPDSAAARAFAQAATGEQGGTAGDGTASPSGSSPQATGDARPDQMGAATAGTGTETGAGDFASQTAPAPSGEEQAAAGAGIGHDNGGAPLAGRDSPPAPPGRDARVPTADGAGPSRAQVIDGAAGRGFASRPYARVYADYRAALEDALGATAVPPGQHYLVRRYFDLIRPRAAAGARDRR